MVSCPHATALPGFGKELVERISGKTGIDIRFHIGGDFAAEIFFYSRFDAGKISNEEKLKEIDKRTRAFSKAYNLCRDKEMWKEFWEKCLKLTEKHLKTEGRKRQ